MTYHIALSREFDLEGIEQAASQGLRPRHILWSLQQRLNAVIHQPSALHVTMADKVLAKLIGQPMHWALARQMVKQLQPGDVVFCTGEDIGFPLAIALKWHNLDVRLAVSVMAPDRTRVKGVMKLFQLHQHIAQFFVNTKLKTVAMTKLGVPSDRVYVLPEQTDIRFFFPGPVSPDKPRPLIASGGLEQRDYQTLALAAQDMDIDIRICAVSPNASANTSVRFPDPIPSNMVIQQYDWQPLRQLYRDADIVVVSLLPNDYSAGLTTMVEALACRRPVIITRTCGLAEELANQGVVIGVDPQDVEGLRKAIATLLANPDLAETQASIGYETAMKCLTSEHHLDCLASRVEALASKELASVPT